MNNDLYIVYSYQCDVCEHIEEDRKSMANHMVDFHTDIIKTMELRQ